MCAEPKQFKFNVLWAVQNWAARAKLNRLSWAVAEPIFHFDDVSYNSYLVFGTGEFINYENVCILTF